MNFDQVFDRLIDHEGGYVNDKNDPGGETKFGISKRTYPHLDIRSLTIGQAREIYLRDFWDPLKADRLHDGVAFQLFDFAVNSGIGNAIRGYQRALGVIDDGAFGPLSLKASKAMSESDQIMLVLAERLSFMRKLKNWRYHSAGWAERIAQNLRFGAIDS